MKRWVFKRVLKESTVAKDLTEHEIEFQKRGATKEKDCSPILRDTFGLINFVLSLTERRFLPGQYKFKQSFK